MSDSSVNFRGMVARLVNRDQASFAAGHADAEKSTALRQDELADLIKGFGSVSGDELELAWLKSEYRNLYDYFTKPEFQTKLVDGMHDPAVLKAMAAELDQKISESKTFELWAGEGLSPAYEGRAREFHNDKEWDFLQLLKGGNGETGPRFIMPEGSYRPLVREDHERGNILERITNLNLIDDLKERLSRLGLRDDEIDIGKQERPGALGLKRDYLHIPPVDAALLMDAHNLEQRGEKLLSVKDGNWSLVQRTALPEENDRSNVFCMPVNDFLGMRGVAYGMPENASAEEILAKCRQRLVERGITEPKIGLTDVGGHVSLAMPTDQARVLLAPIATGDPATKLSLKKMTDHDPRAHTYCAENGVLLVQAGNLAYEEPDVIKKYADAWGFKNPVFIENKTTDAQAWTAFDEERNCVVLAFRGTAGSEDLATDADFLPANASKYGEGEAHKGFMRQLDSILDDVLAAIKPYMEKSPPAELMIGGHSLGGALAGLFTSYCLKHKIPVAQVYTHGQPKVGDSAFCDCLAHALEEQGTAYFRYVNNNDIVPRIPPQWDHGFGKELYIDRFGELHPPGAHDGWDRFFDRARSSTLNLLTGGTFARGPDVYADHSADFYLGFVRKNRDKEFPENAMGVVKRFLGGAANMVGNAVDAAQNVMGNAMHATREAFGGAVDRAQHAMGIEHDHKPDEAAGAAAPPTGPAPQAPTAASASPGAPPPESTKD